jgi:hypothetical protein
MIASFFSVILGCNDTCLSCLYSSVVTSRRILIAAFESQGRSFWLRSTQLVHG